MSDGRLLRIVKRVANSAPGALVASLLLFVLMFGTGADVTLRYVFGKSLPGWYELAPLLMVATVFSALAHTEAQGRHIRIDILLRLLPSGCQRILNAVAFLSGLIFAALIAWQGGKEAWVNWEARSVMLGPVPWPTWPAWAAYGLGALSLCLRFAVELFNEVRQLFSGSRSGTRSRESSQM